MATGLRKELIDNALDAAEEAEVAPVISIAVTEDTIVIEDNAGGIDAETIASVLDYTIRVSTREAYVSPTRGAQGNALKTILAMGYVLDRRLDHADDAAGVTIIESRGVAHRIEFRVDQSTISRRSSTRLAFSGQAGTRFTIHWPAKLPSKPARPHSSSSCTPMSGSIRISRSAGHGSGGNSSTRRRPIRLGQVAAAQSDHPPLV